MPFWVAHWWVRTVRRPQTFPLSESREPARQQLSPSPPSRPQRCSCPAGVTEPGSSASEPQRLLLNTLTGFILKGTVSAGRGL